MKYSEVFRNSVFASSIPVENLEKNAGSAILFMRYDYEQAIEEFNKKLDGACKVIKKEGFDERLRKLEKMKDVENRLAAAEKWNGEGEEPKKVTDEEKAEMETWKNELGDFETEEYAKYIEQRENAHNELMDSECPITISKLTREQYTEVVGAIGVKGNMDNLFNSATKEPLSKEGFLMYVLRFLVA